MMMKAFNKFALLLAFSLVVWACGSNNQTEETQNEEVTEEVDDRPATAEKKDDFYVRATIGEEEYTFDYLPMQMSEASKYNLLMKNGESTLLRIERGADDNMDKEFYIQFHNFNIMPDSLGSVATEGENKQEVICSFKVMDKEGKTLEHWKDDPNSKFTFTLNSVEGDIYEGDFTGKLIQRTDKNAAPKDIKGSFKVSVVKQGELAQKDAV